MIWPSCRVNYPVGDLFPLRRDTTQVTEYKRESGTDGIGHGRWPQLHETMRETHGVGFLSNLWTQNGVELGVPLLRFPEPGLNDERCYLEELIANIFFRL